MGEYYDQMPDNIKDHLLILVKNADKEGDDDYLEAISKAWVEKMKSFEAETALFAMEQNELFEKDNKNGALIMTYSGSLINIGPLVNGKRKVEYASIGLRTDVPDKAVKEDSLIDSDIKVNEAASFKNGPIKKSSPIYKIAILDETITVEEQQEKLTEATQILTDSFVEVNKTIVQD